MANPQADDGQEPPRAPALEPVGIGWRRGRWFAALLVGSAVLVAALAAAVSLSIEGGVNGDSSPSPGAGSSAGRLAFVDGAGALAVADHRGGSVVSLAVAGVVFGPPAWSPDGTRIAVIGSGPDTAGIYVFDVGSRGTDGSAEPTVIYRSADRLPFYLFWSPDGGRVAFLATEPAGISLRVAPADGSAPLDGGADGGIIREGAPLYFAWEDASRLLVHVGVGSDAFVGEVDLKGAPVGPVLPGTGDFRAAGASSDGRYLAYARGDPAAGEIVVESRDGASRQHLSVFGPAALAFDPTGNTLASIAADKPITDPVAFPVGPLRLLDAGTGAVRTLIEGSAIGFFWSPDGRTVATLRLGSTGGLSAQSASIFAPAAMTRPLAAATPAPSVQVHLTFVDVATGDVRSDRTVRLADDFVGTILPYFDQYALSHRIWAPDSTSIVLPLVDSNERSRAVVLAADGADGAAGRPVADAIDAFWAP